MTIDEAIKHCEEVAWENDKKAMCVEEAYQTTEQQNCEQCAADHRRLAEWLTELKERREQPVIHAAWIETTPNDFYEWYKCSNCKYTDTKKFNYCPKCGAKMDC